jgi:hypothetical protein
MDETRPVWRLEFQVMREVLVELGVPDMQTLMQSLGGVWGYATQQWLRLAQPVAGDSNRGRWPTHPLWERLAEVRWRLDDEPLLRKFSPARVPSEEKLFRMHMSILTSFMAAQKITDFCQGRDLFIKRSQAFHTRRCTDGSSLADWVEAQVRLKGRRFNTLLNIPRPWEESRTPDEVDADAAEFNTMVSAPTWKEGRTPDEVDADAVAYDKASRGE